MYYGLFFGGERIEFSAGAFYAIVYGFGAFALSAFEQEMLGEMCRPVSVSAFISCPAFYGEGAVCDFGI